jgi:hypothetical protein
MASREETVLEFVLLAISLIKDYGVPAFVNIMKSWDVENPTIEDIKALKLKVPPPEEYFK